MVAWFKEFWSTILILAVVAIGGGFAGAWWPTYWFQQGICG